MSTSTETQIARLVQALYGSKLGADTMTSAVAAVDAGGGLATVMNLLFQRDLSAVPIATLAAHMVQNLGISGTANVAESAVYIASALSAAPVNARGAVLLDLVNLLPTLTGNAGYSLVALQFNVAIDSAVAYAHTTGSVDALLPSGVFDPATAPWLHIDTTPAPTPAPAPSPTPAPAPPPPPPSATELNLKALSDTVAAAIGNNALPDEGLEIALTNSNPSTKYRIDTDGDGFISAAETIATTVVLGTDNIIGGNANDRLILGTGMLGMNNLVDLGAQQDNTVLATLRKGTDVVTYRNGDMNSDGIATSADAPLRPSLTIALDSATSARVVAAGGALDDRVTTDTLRNVEVVNVVDAATSDRYDDRIDLSNLTAGATVNYGGAEAVGRSLGGGASPPTTVVQLDGNTLDVGGISLAGSPLGREALTLQGVVLIERVTGSPSDDRVILAPESAMQIIASGSFATANSIRTTSWDQTTGVTGGFLADRTDWPDQGLYRFDLGDGKNDSLDYRQESLRVVVSVGTSVGGTDLVYIGSPGTGRVDIATGVERYFGGTGGGAGQNWIDLAAATVPTTVRFSQEAVVGAPALEYSEPDGTDGLQLSGLTRTAAVTRTDDGAMLAQFVDRTGAGIVPASLWQNVQGSPLAEAVIFSDGESVAVQRLQLAGGLNRVDYGRLSTPIVATLGAVDVTANALPQQSTINGDVVQQFLAGDPVLNHLSIVGSSLEGDALDVTGLANGAVVRADPAKPTSSQVDRLFHVVDLSAGSVTESLFGQYVPVGTDLLLARAFVTQVSGFEGATNAGDADAVHLLGDNNRNILIGGDGADLIVGGRGSAGNLGADVGLGQRGDRLTGGAGADTFLYRSELESPGGTIAGGQQAASDFGNNEYRVTNSRDTITDFSTGIDKLAIVIDDGYDVVRAAGGVPPGVAGTLNSVAPLALSFAASDTRVDLPRNAAAASSAGLADNYRFDTQGSTLTSTDVVLRVMATADGDVIDASAGLAAGALNAASADGVRVDIVYTDKTQSQGSAYDQILHFTTGEDKIDLSFLKLPRHESVHAGNGVEYDTNHNNVVDALETGLVRVLAASPVYSINAPVVNMFIDTGTYRPVATQSYAAGGGTSTVVFIDVDGDGSYRPDQDMVLVLVGVGAPGSGDFIVDQYGGGWGG